MSDPDSHVAPMPYLQPSFDSGGGKKGCPPGSNNKKPAAGPVKKAAKAELNRKKLNSLRFNDEEDLALCRAYVNVTGCAVAGTQRTSAQFWVDVVNKYNAIVLEVNSKEPDGTAEKPPLRSRDAESVKNRWQLHIGKDMTHFVAEYRRSKTKTKSGWNDDKYVDDAMNKYRSKYGGKFTFLHCWKVLSELPKFDPAILDPPEEKIPGDGRAVDLCCCIQHYVFFYC